VGSITRSRYTGFQSANKATTFWSEFMPGREIIDLTGDDDKRKETIDLTIPSNDQSGPSKSRSASFSNKQNGPSNPQQKTRNRQRVRKPQKEAIQVVDADPSPSNTQKSSGEKLANTTTKDDSKPTNSSNNSKSKRKRRESIDSIATVNTNPPDVRPPHKRHKSGNAPPDVEEGEVPESNKSSKRRRGSKKPQSSRTNGQAPNDKSHVESSTSHADNRSSSKPSSSNQRRKTRSSQSPNPETNRHSNTRSRRRARSGSITSSPAASDLFFVDMEPDSGIKHEEEVVTKAPVYHSQFGSLLLPEHVLLETAEEAIMTPGQEIFPPPSPAGSTSSIDIIDDNAKVCTPFISIYFRLTCIQNGRRYWEPEPEAVDQGECRICGQYHTSKLCVGTSVVSLFYGNIYNYTNSIFQVLCLWIYWP
jgi:hypothetical protein